MAKNREYNAKARSTMKKALLKRMAENAKKAKDDLAKQMRWTAGKFAAAAKLENKRYRATIKRSRKTREIMRKNKKEYNHNLHMAVLNQQRALAALDASTNAKIKKTNANIAANAAQIKTNALKARHDLDNAMDSFDKKMLSYKQEAEKGRSKLAATAATMDKKVRAMVTLKIKEATAYAAKEFQDVRTTMAKNRHEADMALSAQTTRFKAALASARALQNKRFKQTVADIAKARAEADAMVNKMKQGFKMAIYQLSAVVKHATAKLNNRVTQLQGVVTSNKLEQAKVNSQVDKELKNMIAIGNKREDALAKKDAALRTVMKQNKAATEKKMEAMAKEFYLQLQKIRAQMKKDRAYQEKRLGQATGALFATLRKNVEEQNKKNEKLTEETRQARLDSENALREAKHGFANKLGALHETVVKNDKKANKKVQALTGVVAQNAMKDQAGRELLKMQSKANKLELKNAVRDAVAKGENRARQIEKMAKNMNKKTQDAMNARISTEIGTLSKKIHGDIETLNLQTKAARAEMKQEILYSLRSESQLLKKQLADTVKWANKKFQALDENLEKEESESAKGRAHLKETIDAEKATAVRAIKDAVLAQSRGLMALKSETETKIKKTNRDVAAYGEQIAKHSEEVAKTMAANVKTLSDKINAAKTATRTKLANADAASLARHEDALNSISTSLAAAKQLNDKLAAHAALEDTRFAKSVKNLEKAKKDTWADVTAALKNSETRIQGDIQNVAEVVE